MGIKRPAGKIGRPARVSGEKHTKERIFDAAVALFAREGYDRTSVRRIAEAVEVTESAVYRHYPSKDAILDAICDYMEARIFAPLPVERGEGKPGEDSIFRGLLAVLPRMIAADPLMMEISRIFYSEMSHNAKIRGYLGEAAGERGQAAMEALLASFVAKGAIRPCDTGTLARVFNAFRTDWIFQNFILNRNESLGVERLEADLEPAIHFFEEQFLAAGGAR